MRIQDIAPGPIHFIPHLRARAGGGTERAALPVLLGKAEGLPAPLDAIVCAGDLQGVEEKRAPGRDPRLLGETVAEEVAVLLEVLGVPPARTGAVLSGDLYSAPLADQRGVSGDVRGVWDAFGTNFRWAAGVAGNHDRIGTRDGESLAFALQPNVYYLDGDSCSVDGLTLAGIGGIIGNPAKEARRAAGKYLSELARLNRLRPDAMILHLSPEVASLDCIGSEELGAFYKQHDLPLTICGHVHWPQPLAELSNGNQILNVDSRVVVLQRSV